MSKPTDRNYTNANRAGETKPGVIETISPKDPRHRSNRGLRLTGRAVRRANGQRVAVDLVSCLRLPLRQIALLGKSKKAGYAKGAVKS